MSDDTWLRALAQLGEEMHACCASFIDALVIIVPVLKPDALKRA
jgi:hypothetical protein